MVTSAEPIVQLLYLLMRDHVPTTIIEDIVTRIVEFPDEILYTNGWLARYAMDLANDLKTQDPAESIGTNSSEH
jgi:hypothetical protein